jgi:hypothetical protein
MATALSMPFDAVRIRCQTQRALPNGKLPYANSIDAFLAMYRYESQMKYNSNGGCYFAGSYAAFVRLFVITYASIRALDYYNISTPHHELWAAPTFSYKGGIDLDVHEPYTLAFHKGVAYHHQQPTFTGGALVPGAKGGITPV